MFVSRQERSARKSKAGVPAAQKATYGPFPAGVACPSIAVNTVFPKKNGSPKSKLFEFSPPTSLNAEKLFWNRVLAFATLNVMVRAEPTGVPFELSPRILTEIACVVPGQ